jgi:hypothetical protein
VFADLLGFAALTRSQTIDVQDLRARPFSMSVEDILRRSQNPLTHAFWSFHHSLDAVIGLAEMSHAVTAIAFSDSVFIATDYLCQATEIAANLARYLLPQKVPVRMGIAFGSFAAVHFDSRVSSEGGRHAAQFLGTAVVRAYEAEKCGIKGVRILLHPTVEPLFTNEKHNPDSPPFGGHKARLIPRSQCRAWKRDRRAI